MYDTICGATVAWKDVPDLNKFTTQTLKDAGVYDKDNFTMYEVKKLWRQFHLVYMAEKDPNYILVRDKMEKTRVEQEIALHAYLYPHIPYTNPDARSV